MKLQMPAERSPSTEQTWGACGYGCINTPSESTTVEELAAISASPGGPKGEDPTVAQLLTEIVEHRNRLQTLEENLNSVGSRSRQLPSGDGKRQKKGRSDLIVDTAAVDLEEGLQKKLENLKTDSSSNSKSKHKYAKVKTDLEGGSTPPDPPSGPPTPLSDLSKSARGPKPQAPTVLLPGLHEDRYHLPNEPTTPKTHGRSIREAQTPKSGAETKRMFDQDMVQAIYDKPHRKSRQKGSMIGAGLLGIMSMPFGPIGMVGGGTIGALIGGTIGFYLDRRKERKEMQESEKQKKKLKSLVRWALDHFHEEETFIQVIEMVTLEFKPVADIADGSKHARKLLKLLDAWIAQKKVTRNLWRYMDGLLQRWKELNRGDFVRSLSVFQTLCTMYRHSQRVLDEQEIQFLHRMERLLEHESVKLIMQHAVEYPTQGETRLMECMVYADTFGNSRRKRSKSHHGHGAMGQSPSGASTPQGPDSGNESESDEDSILSHYTAKGTYIGRKTSGSQVIDDQELKFFPSERGDSGDKGDRPDTPSKSPMRAEPVMVKVLKKPFFKNFEDFMDFDCTFKHKMPITLSEFELLRQKSEEPLKGWDLCVDRKEIQVAKIQNDTGCITLRAWATVPGVDIHVAFYLFADHRERVKWDKSFSKMDVLATQQGSDIFYSILSVPMVTPRDFLQWRRVRILEDGSIHIVLRSAEHPDMPDQKGVIRAESFIAGYILRQEFEGSTPVLKLFLMTCVDIKGLIPKWIINAAAPRKPAEWIGNLKKAAIDYQQANPDYKRNVVADIEKYRTENPYDYEEVVQHEVSNDQGDSGTSPEQVNFASGGTERSNSPSEVDQGGAGAKEVVSM